MLVICFNLILIFLCLNARQLSALNIKEPPSIRKGPKHEQLYQVSQLSQVSDEDKSFTLECEASGNPEPDFRWTKNGLPFDPTLFKNRIHHQAKNGTLVFTKPEPIDEGIYQCFAENALGTSVSNSVFLRRAELNSFSDEALAEIPVTEGDPLSIECTPPSGCPKPTVLWIVISGSGALRSINSSRLTVDPEGSLHFSNVTQDDVLPDGMYACSATPSLLSVRTEYKIGKKVTLDLKLLHSDQPIPHQPVRQYTSPSTVTVLRGEKLELHCIYGGTPLPAVKWKKDGNDILTDRRTNLINAGKTLQIFRVAFEDEGGYECIVDNGVGRKIRHSISVIVQAAPYWVRWPNSTHKAEGESVEFECIAEGVPSPNLQWLMNGQPIEQVPPNYRRVIRDNKLSITDLRKEDTAVYQCNATNNHGYAFKDFFINILLLPPSFIQTPQSVTRAAVDSTVILTCRVFGAPKPEIKWYKDGIELKGTGFNVGEDGDLTISKVAESDEGDYICSASNKLDKIEAKGKLEVKKKTRIIKPPKDKEIAAGRSTFLECMAEADKTLTLNIEWSFNGVRIDYEEYRRFIKNADNSLAISKAEEDDSGIYTCTARTDIDSDTANATVIVQDVPKPPRIVNVECDNLTALIEWIPSGDGRSPITGYTIQYNTSFTSDWYDAFANVPAVDSKFKVSLSPWANYTFRVIATNKIGSSLPSQVSDKCTTGEDVPHKNPDGVVGRGTTPHNMVISWKPMPKIEQNAPGFYYKVFWKREDIPNAQFNMTEILDWKKDELEIDNQPTFKPYRIKVEAHNRKGPAHTVATEVIGYSGEDKPLEAPQDFRLEGIKSAKAAEFSWNPVSPESIRGHFRGYKLESWVFGNEKDKRDIVVPSNVTRNVVVEIFKPAVRNVVHVFAINDQYEGPPSEKVAFDAQEGTPGPVSDFNIVAMGSKALYLTWEEPEEPNGNITFYRIAYQQVNGTQLSEKIVKEVKHSSSSSKNSGEKYSLKLSQLQPATAYRITITAWTSKGEGEPDFREASTLDPIPVIPDIPNFEATALLDPDDSKSQMRVKWLPALDGKPGSSFYVQYKKKGDEQFKSTPKNEESDVITIYDLERGATYDVIVVAVDETFETKSKPQEVTMGPGKPFPVVVTKPVVGKIDWLIGMICAIALVIILAIIVCLVKRNRGGKYSVHEKEAALGKDFEPEDAGFNEYSKPTEPLTRAPVDSRTSLTGSYKHPEENDVDSMTDYGEDDSSKFGEDGSFIGQYGKKKQSGQQSPTGVATFV
ncbi:neuronal cell adhesion molecule-like protein [Dinothrombium tinctorium]|uniref:Neuronal cell adhesion molecule-like protein n=1 Tax=Dinothrombium tinctorium TaxID=1965070 RepID=A0A3S3PHH9_9ACAR|nr:neuronal cell adhesion molecule-like protein [Dinothrombium tinctorium]